MTGKQLEALKLGRQKGLKRNRPSGLKYTLHKDNPTSFKKGCTSWTQGLPEDKHPNWKGESVGYWGIHSWIEKKRGLARYGKCENCDTRKNLQWSNVSNNYKREVSDWQILCARCHQRYDYEKFGVRARAFEGSIRSI